VWRWRPSPKAVGFPAKKHRIAVLVVPTAGEGAAPPENHHRCAGYAAPRKRADAQLPEPRFRPQRAAERRGAKPRAETPAERLSPTASARRVLVGGPWAAALRPRARPAWSTRDSRRTARWKAPGGAVRGAYSNPREARRLRVARRAYIPPLHAASVEASAAVVFERVAAKALEEALARIIRKASEGKRLSDSEVALLVMGLMLRRLDDLKAYVDRGADDLDKRVDDLKAYVDKGFADLKGYVDEKFDDLKAYVDKEIADLKAYVDKRVDDLKSYVDSRFDSVEKRIDDLRGYVDGRFNGVEGRLGALEKRLDSVEGRLGTIYSEVSSIKTDIIKMMRELLERAYGGKG